MQTRRVEEGKLTIQGNPGRLKLVMDLVEWCDHVLSKLIEVRSSSDALHHGLVYDSWLAEALYGKEQTAQPDYWASSRRKGLLDALDVLEEFGLIIKKKSGQVFQLDVKPLGREKVGELHTLWKGILSATPQPESAELLQLVNKLSQQVAPDHASLQDVDGTLFADLGWGDVKKRATAVSDLEQFGFVNSFPRADGDLRWTYGGLVWETRRRLLQKCDVFISHITEEKELAGRLKTFLHGAFGDDLKVFVSSDYRSIPGGRLWYTEIIESLVVAPVVLVLLTEASVERRWINFEAGVGIGSQSLVIPLVSEGFPKSKVGLPLSQLQVRSLSDSEDVVGVLDDVGARIKRSAAKVDASAFVKGIVAAVGPKLTAEVKYVPERVYDDYQDHRFTVGLINNSSDILDDYRVEIELPNHFLNPSTSIDAEVEARRTPEHRFFRVLIEGVCRGASITLGARRSFGFLSGIVAPREKGREVAHHVG